MRTKYKLKEKEYKDYVYTKIKRDMYGLKQAATLTYKQLVDHRKKYDYEPIMGTTYIFKHRTRRTKFCLCVDDSGVKNYDNDDLQHFLNQNIKLQRS